MTRRSVLETKYTEVASAGRYREGITLVLICGHEVHRVYNNRQAYTHANCEWCRLEKQTDVKYVYNPWFSQKGEPEYIPDRKIAE